MLITIIKNIANINRNDLVDIKKTLSILKK